MVKLELKEIDFIPTVMNLSTIPFVSCTNVITSHHPQLIHNYKYYYPSLYGITNLQSGSGKGLGRLRH